MQYDLGKHSITIHNFGSSQLAGLCLSKAKFYCNEQSITCEISYDLARSKCGAVCCAHASVAQFLSVPTHFSSVKLFLDLVSFSTNANLQPCANATNVNLRRVYHAHSSHFRSSFMKSSQGGTVCCKGIKVVTVVIKACWVLCVFVSDLNQQRQLSKVSTAYLNRRRPTICSSARTNTVKKENFSTARSFVALNKMKGDHYSHAPKILEAIGC